MPEDNQQPIISRPMARPSIASAPLQRGNYGIPPRQTAAVTAAPRFVDVVAPTTNPTIATPVQPIVQPIMTTPQQPVFNATRPRTKTNSALHNKIGNVTGKLGIITLVVGALLLTLGAARLVTAGSVAGYTVAVGAVTANDGHKTSVQFTADDGLLHHFSYNGSSRTQIPGTAMQVAYQPGAADATVKRVLAVQKERKLGSVLIASGGSLLILGGSTKLITRHRIKLASKAPSPASAHPIAA